MQPEISDKTFKVKYVTGHTILSNRPGESIFYGNKVKVVIDATKDEAESTLFDVPISEVEVYVEPSGKFASAAQSYIVAGKTYAFLPNDGSFLGDIQAINQALTAGGAKVPSGITPSKSNQAYAAVIIIIALLVIVFFLFSIIKHK